MRKTSAYARKMRRRQAGEVFNGAEWLNTLQRCRQYTPEPLPGSWLPGNISAAENMRQTVQTSLHRLCQGQVKPEETDPFDHLAHAVGVAMVRTHETPGDLSPGSDKDRALEALGLAKIALGAIKKRWQRINRWGATRIEQEALAEAVELYETILMNSSPAQMSEAAHTRLRLLKQMGWADPPETQNGGPKP